MLAAIRKLQTDRQAMMACQDNLKWLLLGSGVVTGPSRHQACDEGAEQGFAASACVVHELEEAEIKRQLVLRDAAVRSEPGAQQRPEPFMWTALE